MSKLVHHLLISVFFVFASLSAHATDCQQFINVDGGTISDTWSDSDNCDSNNRYRYDPYGNQSYPAKYYTFELDRDADIRIDINGGYSEELFLLNGNNPSSPTLLSYQGGQIQTRLSAGTYTIEATNTYARSFELTLKYNDTGNATCVSAIQPGETISDGWTPNCQSNSRDIIDPYNTIPGEGHRAKYFTFSLENDTDIRIDVSASVNSYVYILSGEGEFATPYEDFSQETINTYLPQGTYTIELTTHERYSPGNFDLTFNTFTNESGCDSELTLNAYVSGAWSPDCLIRSWIDENGDPYQGDSPERANYYNFTLTEAQAIQFNLTANNDRSTIMNLYAADDYYNKLATARNNSSNSARTFSRYLEAGSYSLELSKSNELAIGSYSFSTTAFANDECSSAITLGSNASSYLSPDCLSLHRVFDGIDDPYGAQPGTYYAKRFEFTLAQAQTVYINAATSPNSGHLYLSKRMQGQDVLLTESSHTSTTSPFMIRELDAGTYLIEVTSAYPETQGAFSVNLNSYSGYACESYLSLNTRKNAFLGSNSTCRSNFKDATYNWDPYGPSNGWQYYYARSYTFEIATAGSYDIQTQANGFTNHVFLIAGGNAQGEVIAEQNNGQTITQYLESGLYTIEVTSLYPNQTSSYSVLVWDRSSEIDEGDPLDDSIPDDPCTAITSLSNGSNSLNGTWTSDCHSTSRNGRFAKYYRFDMAQTGNVQIDLTSSTDTYLYLQHWSGNEWTHINSNDDGGSGLNSRLNQTLYFGTYRIEATTFSSGRTGNFSLMVNGSGFVSDRDADGTPDSEDSFPDDANETVDTDNDGIGNNADLDIDNDGVLNINDAFPLDANASLDSDLDGIADHEDATPYPMGGDIRFTMQTIEINEDANTARVIVERISDYPSITSTVYFYTQDQTAVSSVDYTSVSGQITFDESSHQHEIEIPIIDNQVFEKNKTFSLLLAYASEHYPVSLSQGNRSDITIIEDDATPTGGLISFKEKIITVNEAQESTEIIIERTVNTDGGITLYLQSKDRKATAFNDYEALSYFVRFEEGETEKRIILPITDNSIFERTEDLELQLDLIEGDAVVINNTLLVNIEDDEPLPSGGLISLPATALKITEADMTIDLSLVRTEDSSDAVSIAWNTLQGTARPGINYQDSGGVVEFNTGRHSQPLSIQILDNFLFQGIDTEFCIEFSVLSGNAILDDDIMCISIIENDMAPLEGFINFSNSLYTGDESDEIAVTLNRLFANSDQANQVSLRTIDYTANEYEDYTAIDQNIILNTGEVTKTVMIKTIDDSLYESNEELTLNLTQGDLSTSIPIIIKDNETKLSGAFRFSGSEYSVAENAGTLSIVVQRVYGDIGNATINIKSKDGSALNGKNYTGVNQSVSFENGETSKTVTFNILNDGQASENIEFELILESETGETLLHPRSAIVKIQDTGASKSDDGFLGLGLGSITPLWLLTLLLPMCLVRVRTPIKI